MIKIIILSTLMSSEQPKVIEGSLFNEYDYVYAIEAKRRRGKGGKGDRRRGGGGLR